ncbi:MAG TPA: methionyl-tRNA formyltransferase [Terriglobales bacterium]|nr:methionyl-tRNA formyltransferase [Terriglobales bacterium]
MDVVFCGTPQFAVPALSALVESGFSVRLVVSQPDRPAGRGLTIVPTPVKQCAMEHGIPVIQPEKIKANEEFRSQLLAIRPAAIIVVAYGRIIPQWMIDLPPLGNINVHASLLPKYRGAAPIQWAIAMGETVTGVTTMRIDAGLDTGDMLLKREVPILPEDTAETLAPKLSEAGGSLLVETLRKLEAGIVTPIQQDHSQATLAPILKKEDGRIDWNRTATEIWNRLRGFTPWPGAFTTYRGKNLNIWKAHPAASGTEPLAPGQMHAQGDHLYVGCGQSTVLEIIELQPEGKKRMSARDFVNGYKPENSMIG